MVRIKDRFQNPVNGYRDILLNLEMANSHIVEMQLHLRSILDVKNGIGHKLYEEIRTIQAVAKRKGCNLTPQEMQKVKSLKSQMEESYNKAYRTFLQSIRRTIKA